MYRPYPFSWVPAAGARHASGEEKPLGGWPDGTVVTTLCGQKLPSASGQLAWLWETCPACSVAAHKLAGVPMAGAR